MCSKLISTDIKYPLNKHTLLLIAFFKVFKI